MAFVMGVTSSRKFQIILKSFAQTNLQVIESATSLVFKNLNFYEIVIKGTWLNWSIYLTC